MLRGSWRLARLTVNYRTPAVVAEAAQEVARAGGLPAGDLTSARDVPDALQVQRVGTAGLTDAVVRTATRAVDDVAGTDGDADEGRVAVIAAPERVAGLRAALEASAVAGSLGRPGRSPLDARLAVLTPRETKGLEFDVVVLVEPAEITGSDLYVAMTRPTRALRVVAAAPLPAGFPG